MIHQLQYPGLIQSDYHVIADKKRGNPAQTAPGKFCIGLRVIVNILFHEADILLGKKLFRRPAMGSGLGGEQHYFLHKNIASIDNLFMVNC